MLSSLSRGWQCAMLLALLLASLHAAYAWNAKNQDVTFGLKPEQIAKDYAVQQMACSGQSNVFWPGEEKRFTVQIVNKTDKPLKATGQAQTIAYGTTSDPMDGWTQFAVKFADAGSVPITVDLPANGYTNLVIAPVVPNRFGAYALIIDLPGHGRQFAASFLYVPKAMPGKVRNPTYALDLREVTPEMCGLWQRLGIKGTRNEIGYTRTEAAAEQMARLGRECKMMSDYDITVMLCIEGGDWPTNPFGRFRSWLDKDDVGKFQYLGDAAWSPKWDNDFQRWVRIICANYGWPYGPVNAVELWNEPWEGISISGWGADLPRYREMYEKMARGVIDARQQAHSQVLIGGTCSSMNTEDKLFGDGKDTFLPWLDFTSIHYQPLGNVPSIIPQWMERKSELGPVQPWDTESWIANSEDRVAAVIATMRASGLTRTAGVLHDVIRETGSAKIRTATGTKTIATIQAYPCGAGIAATQYFLGERSFREILFNNGLPWVIVFDGLPNADGTPNPEDGTVVVLGDMGSIYERGLSKFRTVLGVTNVQKVAEVQQKIDALPATATKAQRDSLQRDLKLAEMLTDGKMTLPRAKSALLYDFYGNPMPAVKGDVVIPLNGYGYFLRGDGKPGSFAKLLEALRKADITGYEPLEIKAQDLPARIEQQPGLVSTLTNVLNRPVTGTLTVKLGALTLDQPAQTLTFQPWETRTLVVKVTGGAATDNNTYPLTVTFDAGAFKGTKEVATLTDTMHVNMISKRTITVDGKLDDWNGVLPQVVKSSADSGPNLTEKAWLPFINLPEKVGNGLAVAYLAYDANHFYFAAKVADPTPNSEQIRFATRNDDDYYFPEKSYMIENGQKKEMIWPAGERRFSYRKNPDLPFGDDAIQIAFNVVPQEKKGMYPYPKGTMPQYQVYKDTDYEYFLHPVGKAFGGGAEIWRLLAPGVPRKHFYPRQPKAVKDGGPVDAGKLVVMQDGTQRVTECALPWSEIPEVKAALDAGSAIKFTFRVTDDKGPSYEMAANRSVSKWNPLTFHEYWGTHWANEMEFSFEK